MDNIIRTRPSRFLTHAELNEVVGAQLRIVHDGRAAQSRHRVEVAALPEHPIDGPNLQQGGQMWVHVQVMSVSTVSTFTIICLA